MTRNLKVSLLIASTLVVLGATSSQACCHFRRGCQHTQSYCQSGYGYASPTGYLSSGQGGSVTSGGGYYGGWITSNLTGPIKGDPGSGNW